MGRGLTFLSSLAAAVLVWASARGQGAGQLAALAGASLLLPLPFLDEWGYAVRPDLPAVALSLAALLVLSRHPARPWLAAIVAVLAFFTKQTAIALPIAATLWLSLDRRWRAATVFVATWTGLALAGIALLEVSTGSRYLLNTVLAHLYTPKNGFDLASRDMLPLFTEGWLPVGLAILATALLVVRRGPSLPALYVAVATVSALVTLRTVGSDVNYLIEPAAAACILAALAINYLSPRDDRDVATFGLPLFRLRGPEGRGIQIAGAIALVVATVLWGYEQWGYWHVDGGVKPTGRLPVQEIAAVDTVLSEEPLAVLLAGKPLFVSDTFHVSMLVDRVLRPARPRTADQALGVRPDRHAGRHQRTPLLEAPVDPARVGAAGDQGRLCACRTCVGLHWLYRPSVDALPPDRRHHAYAYCPCEAASSRGIAGRLECAQRPTLAP